MGRAEARFRLGQLQEAAESLREALALLTEHPDRAEQLRAEGLLAALEMARGEERSALNAADRAARLIDQLPSPTAHYLLEGYAGVAEVRLRAWEGAGRRLLGPDRRATERSALRACSALRGFARVFPIGRPRAWLFHGWAEWLAGRQGPAQAAWRRSLDTAGQLEMRYELGRAHGEIGRHLAEEDPSRVMHLTRAVELLSEVGAASDLARLPEH